MNFEDVPAYIYKKEDLILDLGDYYICNDLLEINLLDPFVLSFRDEKYERLEVSLLSYLKKGINITSCKNFDGKYLYYELDLKYMCIKEDFRKVSINYYCYQWWGNKKSYYEKDFILFENRTIKSFYEETKKNIIITIYKILLNRFDDK